MAYKEQLITLSRFMIKTFTGMASPVVIKSFFFNPIYLYIGICA